MLKKERFNAKIEHSNGTDNAFHRTYFKLPYKNLVRLA